MAPPLMAIKGYASQEVGSTLERARKLGHAPERSLELLAPLWGLFGFSTVKADLRGAQDLAEQLAHIASATKDPVFVLARHHAAGVLAFHRGLPTEARDHLEKAALLADSLQDQLLSDTFGQHPSVSSRGFLALTLWLLGHENQAIGVSEKAISLADDFAQPYTRAFALLFAAWLAAFRRQTVLVRERADTVLAVCEEGDFPLFAAMALMLRAWALSDAGDTQVGVVELRSGLEALEATGARMLRHFFLVLLAEAHGRAHQHDEALSALEEAEAEMEAVGERFYEAEIYRLRAELLHEMSAERSDEVMAALRQSSAVARSQQAASLERRTAATLRRIRASG